MVQVPWLHPRIAEWGKPADPRIELIQKSSFNYEITREALVGQTLKGRKIDRLEEAANGKYYVRSFYRSSEEAAIQESAWAFLLAGWEGIWFCVKVYAAWHVADYVWHLL